MMILISTITPDQAVTIGTGWIAAAFTLLSLVFASCIGFWAKYGTVIQGIIDRQNRHGSQINTLQINAQPPVPTVIVAPVAPTNPASSAPQS